MTLILTLAAGFAALAAPIGQGRTATAPSAHVHYGDLDLTTADGQRMLRKRVSAAERASCTTGPVTGTLIGNMDQDCVKSFRAEIDGQLKAALAKAQDRSGTQQAATKAAVSGAAQ